MRQLPEWSRQQFVGEPGEEVRIRSYHDQEERLRTVFSQLDKFLAVLAVFMVTLAGIGVSAMVRAIILGQRDALGLLPVLALALPPCVGLSSFKFLVLRPWRLVLLAYWANLAMQVCSASPVPGFLLRLKHPYTGNGAACQAQCC